MARLTASLGRTPGPYDPPPAARELTATSADGARIHVEVHGRGSDPAVVLSHGWTCSTAFWGAVIRELTASGHRVIAYDQRGHGRTPGTDPRAYSPATLADDLCAVLDEALEAGERAVVGGHSMGAMTLIAAAGRPDLERRAAALLLCNTGAHRLVTSARIFPVPSRRVRERAQRFLLLSRLPLGPESPVTRRALKYGTLGPGATPEQVAVVARVVHACRPRERGAWGAVLADLDIAANVRSLRPPTAVITGAADRLTPPAAGREIADALPHCTGLHELPRRGHMTPIETPSEVSGVLRALVREHLTDAEAAAGEAAGAAAGTRTDKPGTGTGTKTPARTRTKRTQAKQTQPKQAQPKQTQANQTKEEAP
ncbi:alpha/beta fold hydrolase [Streptomyces winkii]|uniref:alpha/beta fold hydrolase n=1 Tax=Streptomyces winkii TaxID=3051178 RepID=UPI0028D29EB9|nr:alpha/beta hydrolase [Streptomyces sp. DSM 40971]